MENENPKPTDFEKFLPWACKNYNVLPNVIVTKAGQAMYLSVAALTKTQRSKQGRITKSKQLRVTQSLTRSADSIDDNESLVEAPAPASKENVIMVESLYDTHDHLVNLKFLKNKAIPRKIMQVIGIAIPYHKHLTSITINSGLCIDTLYEIAKFLPDSNITELCLDNTYLTKPNYHTLLTHGKLKHLSLVRCSINDAVVKTITDQLGAASPASRVLSALNLSSNRITDVGAKYVAGMLRTNRQLSYLNIAGNMITDEGGMSILDTLQKFPLGSQEILESRARYVAYLKNKYELENILIAELHAAKEDRMTKNARKYSVAQKQSESRLIKEKVAHLAETKMGLFSDHFSPNNIESQDGVTHSFGNNTLCYLNLAYNNLTYVSVKKLRDVLVTQRSLNRTPRGLIRVVIQGNLMPVDCEEYNEINRLLEPTLVGTRKLAETFTKRKS